MTARLLVAVLLSMLVAPVLQADSFLKRCEDARLIAARLEWWAQDASEKGGKTLAEADREIRQRLESEESPCGKDLVEPQLAQADSLSDWCEAHRLQLAAVEQWAKDSPENSMAKIARAAARKFHGDGEPNILVYCRDPDFGKRIWGDPKYSIRSLGLVSNLLREIERYSQDLFWRGDGNRGMSMSFKTVLLFVEARLYATRAYDGRLHELQLLERAME